MLDLEDYLSGEVIFTINIYTKQMFLLEIKWDTKNSTLKSTPGNLFLNGGRFCHTLEDVVRGENIKIAGETAIPAGTYFIDVTMSSRFKRLMPIIFNMPIFGSESFSGYEIIINGIRFVGCRLHGGNRAKDTHGCPLVAYNKIDNDTIQGTAEKDLTKALIALGGRGILIITNE